MYDTGLAGYKVDEVACIADRINHRTMPFIWTMNMTAWQVGVGMHAMGSTLMCSMATLEITAGNFGH
jgi:hypothetical protein